ncbi:DMT family transporter [Pseudotabrizicola sp.]|uniref:DMT family transporter n=1 Tax=Pseudotabrizicola sp. TaxID=2939647 RepID=UPI00271960D7|nr:EamA family transporter [Pseudotabrizicola sp.]MDO8881501.1 EamA family transporter [Pseudotabrizicola sp.]
MNGVKEKAGIALVLLAATLWATVGIGAQLVPASSDIPPEVLGLARTAIAGPVILLVAVFILGPNAMLSTRLDPNSLIIFAASNAVFQIGLFRCFILLGVTVTVFLTVCLPPVMAMVWNWLRRREPVTIGNVIALAHAVVGLGMFVDDRGLGNAVATSAQGLSTAVVASFAFVTMSEAVRSLSRTSPPLMIAGAGLSLSCLMLLVLLPVVSSVGLATLTAGLGDPAALTLILYLGLGPTALAYVCYCTGIAKCRSALVALIASMIEPAVAAGLAVWILSDAPTVPEAIGCTLLMLSMLILWQSERRLSRQQYESGAIGAGADLK